MSEDKKDHNTATAWGTSSVDPPAQPAAGPWQEGEPEEEGVYLVQYGREILRVAALEYSAEGKWKARAPLDLAPSCVLRYAEIHAP